MRNGKSRVALALSVMVATAALGYAQETAAPPKPGFTSMLNVDTMIDNYSKLLGRKYNLTPEQEAYTLQMIRDRSHAFLDENRDQLFPLIDRLFEVRAGGDMSQAEMMEWGRQVRPMYEKAKSIIVAANTEWRQILTEDQKKIHDGDLQLMNTNFAQTDDQIQRMIRGQLTLQEFRTGGQPQAQPQPAKTPAPTPAPAFPQPAVSGQPKAAPPVAQPAKPVDGAKTAESEQDARKRLEELRRQRAGGEAAKQPAAGRHAPRGAPKTPGMAGTDFESKWEQYVREFIQKYQLDESQTQRANSILKDCVDQGRSYLTRKKSTIEDLDKKITEAQGKPEKADDAKQLSDQRAKLLEPLERIFESRLKPRLEKIPTSAQRDAAGAGGKPAPTGAQPKTAPPPPPTGQPKPEQPQQKPPEP